MKIKKHIYASHSSEFDIPFFDVDSMNVMWHGHYVKYFEMARCAFLEEIGFTYEDMKNLGFVWPIVALNIKYVKPAMFRQKVRVELAVLEYETSFRLEYQIFDVKTGERLTKADTTQVVVDITTGELQFQAPKVWCQAVENYSAFNPMSV